MKPPSRRSWSLIKKYLVIGVLAIFVAPAVPAKGVPVGAVVSESPDEGLLVSIEDQPRQLLIGVCPQDFTHSVMTCTALYHGSIQRLCNDYREKRTEIKGIVNGATVGLGLLVSLAVPPIAALGFIASVPFQVGKGIGAAAYSAYDVANELDSDCGSDQFVSEFVRLARDGHMYRIKSGVLPKWSGRLGGLYPNGSTTPLYALPTSQPLQPISLNFTTQPPIEDLDAQMGFRPLEPVRLIAPESVKAGVRH